MRIFRGIAFLAGVLLIILAMGIAVAWKPEIDADASAASQKFSPELISRGARLAALGNCIACHTVPEHAAFAGGLELPTPFGNVYSTNITPDPDTGIGNWSEAAFQRAMREGVDREGHHLYPVFPYDHYTLVTDEDNQALYAYLMTRQPVKATAHANELSFPYNIRLLLAGWKLLYLNKGPFRPTGGNAELDRGRYLAEGLAHCGACHTPRDMLGAEDRSKHFAGGEAEGWQAYPINADSLSPVPWDRQALAQYLRTGWHKLHGISRGPMAEVTGNLAGVPEDDINAIAAYVMSVMGEPTPGMRAQGEKLRKVFDQPRPVLVSASEDTGNTRGAEIYKSTCGTCHDTGQPPFGGLNFSLSTAVNASNPQNIVNVTLFGLPPADGEASSVMPAYAGILNDADMVALLTYLREHFTKRSMWNDLDGLVRRTRSGEHRVTVRPADGIERSPANIGASGSEVTP